MIRSNIKGLANVLNKLDKRIENLEKKNLHIKGGKNTQVRQVGNTLTINSVGSGDENAIADSFIPWRIYIESVKGELTADGEPTEPTKQIRCGGGLINGLLPNNVDTDILSPSKDSDYYVYLTANFNGASITSVEVEASSVGSEPELEYEYNKGAPPSTFRHLIGVVSDQQVTDQYLRRNLKVRPVIAYRQKTSDDSSAIENYWTWDVFPI